MNKKIIIAGFLSVILLNLVSAYHYDGYNSYSRQVTYETTRYYDGYAHFVGHRIEQTTYTTERTIVERDYYRRPFHRASDYNTYRSYDYRRSYSSDFRREFRRELYSSDRYYSPSRDYRVSYYSNSRYDPYFDGWRY